MSGNLAQEIENNRRLLIAGTIAICIAALAVTARRDPFAYDLFWHLQMGLDWLKNGFSPWVDHYSFTAYGEKISGPPYLFQIMVAFFVDKFGLELGTQLFKLCCFLSVFALVLIFLKKIRSPAIIYLLVLPSIVVALQLRAMTRPELLGYSFCVLAVIFYHQAQGRISIRNLIPITLLMLVWNNYHTAIFGYIIFFGFFIDAAILQLKEKSPLTLWLKWSAWGMAVVAVGFIKPQPGYGIFGIFKFNPEWKTFIQEYESTFELYGSFPPVYGLLLLMAAVSILSLREKKFGYLFISAFLLYQSLHMSRLVTPSAITILCLLASLLTPERTSNLRKSFQTGPKIIAFGSVLALSALSLTYAVILARSILYENATMLPRFPTSIADYMVDQKLRGNIFNEYDSGGYLIYRLTPDSRVYIDGRTNILYPMENYKRYLEARNDPEVLVSELKSYNIDLAVLKNDPQAFAVTYNTGRLSPDFFGPRYTLFVRENSNFPLLGKLLAYPACWKSDLHSDLQSEHTKALMLIPQNSFALSYIQTVMVFSSSDSPQDVLNELAQWSTMDENIARFAGYQSLRLGLYSDALVFLDKANYWELGDYLGAAIAHVKLSRWQKAEDLLDQATKIAWRNVTPGQITLLYFLIQQIQENLGSTSFSPEYLQKMKRNILEEGTLDSASKIDLDLLCNQTL